MDLSWNLIGQIPKDQPSPSGKMVKLMDFRDVGKAWGSMFIENKTATTRADGQVETVRLVIAF